MNTGKAPFRESFTDFYNDLTLFISSYSSSDRQPLQKYIDLKDELDEIYLILDENEDDAQSMFQDMDCSRYETFKQYQQNTDPMMIKSSSFTMETTKVMRSKRGITKCPHCNIPLVFFDDSTYGCTNCNFEAPRTYSTPNTKLNINNTKHIIKQIDSLCGQKKIPIAINKIINYIEVWLTDLHYLYDWLVYSNTLNDFRVLYQQLTNTIIDSSWFDRRIERVQSNRWSFKVYKIIMDEFYKMTELARRLMNAGASDLFTMDISIQKMVIDEWLANNTTIPETNDIVTIDDDKGKTVYNIGKFFDTMLYKPSVKRTEIYTYIVERFSSVNDKFSPQLLTIGGLMFDFNDVYKINEGIPKKYNYGQEYFIISNFVFNIPFTEINNNDKDNLLDIIVAFNNYYKRNIVKANGNKNNSPLFGCTLICIIKTLSYFHKYKDIIWSLPNKYIDSQTMDTISMYWHLFIIENPDIYVKYNTRVTEAADETINDESVLNII